MPIRNPPDSLACEASEATTGPHLLGANVIFAMPVGPPFGGMTTYTAMLRKSSLFAGGRAILFDTTPPVGERNVITRLVHALRNSLRLLVAVRRERASVVHFMTSDYLGFYEKSAMALVCQWLGAQCVLHPVGSFVNFYARAGVGRPLIRFILRRVAAVAVVQDRVRDYIRALAPATPVWLIPNPVDCRAFSPSGAPRDASAPVRIVFCGAVVQGKGVLDLVEAVSACRSQLGNAKVIMLGDGDLYDECRRRVHAEGLDGLIELPGFVDEEHKKRVLSESDIFCLPSYSEGTPISVLEAMAAGLAVVATTVGGVPFVVRQGLEGWLVEPGDVDGLGRALVNLVVSRPVRLAMGERGRKRVNTRFDISVTADLLCSRINEMAGVAGVAQ